MTETAKPFWHVFFLRAAATADNLARLNKGYRTKWHSPEQKLLADNIKKRWLQLYANKIIGEERSVIFLRLAAEGFSIAAIGGTTIAAIVMDG